jgi:flavodoxin I
MLRPAVLANRAFRSPWGSKTTMATTLIYGSDSGATRAVANKIAKKIPAKVIDIKKATTADFETCDLLILGVPTYGGGELQVAWEENIDALKNADIAGKKVALFGLGDQATYPDCFLDAMGILYDIVVEKGAEVVGSADNDDFEFEASMALRDGRFVGLAVDQDNQSSKTDKRIAAWIARLP